MNAEQIIASALTGLPDSLFNQQQARHIAQRLRLAGIDLDHTYEQIGARAAVAPVGPQTEWGDDAADRLRAMFGAGIDEPYPLFVRRPLEDQ